MMYGLLVSQQRFYSLVNSPSFLGRLLCRQQKRPLLLKVAPGSVSQVEGAQPLLLAHHRFALGKPKQNPEGQTRRFPRQPTRIVYQSNLSTAAGTISNNYDIRKKQLSNLSKNTMKEEINNESKYSNSRYMSRIDLANRIYNTYH